MPCEYIDSCEFSKLNPRICELSKLACSEYHWKSLNPIERLQKIKDKEHESLYTKG